MAKPKPKQKKKPIAAVKDVGTETTLKKGDMTPLEKFQSDYPSWQERFLWLFGQNLNVASSAAGAGVHRRTVYKERDKDPEFAAAWDDAKREAIERLEAAAFARAQNMSDLLLIFLLKAHRPEVYRENVQQLHTGAIEVIVRREKLTGTTKRD